MKIVSSAVASLLLSSAVVLAQENVFSTHPGSNTVTVVEDVKFAPLPATGALGPNPMAMAASPQTILYDAARTQIYVISTTGGTVQAIDPIRFTTRSVSPPNLTGPLTTGTMDSKYLYAVGADTVAGKYGVYRFDLDDFSPAGVTFVGGVTPAASTTYTPVDVEVVQGKAYFTYSSLFSGTLAVLIHHVGEVDLSTGVFTDVFAVNNSSTTQPRAFTKISRSPDGQMALVSTTTAQSAGSAWQLLRVCPSNAPVVDVLTIPTGCSPSAPEDLVFTTGTSPYTVCMLAADDCSGGAQLRFFTVGTVNPQSAVTNGPTVPAGFGQDMSLDLAHNRLFLGNIGATNTLQILSPPTPAGTWRAAAVNSGGQTPKLAVTAPAPPPLALTSITQPAGVVTAPFQIEMFGSGFLQGSSRGLLIDPGGVNHLASSTQVLSSGRLIATFPAQTVTHYDAGVVNNDGQQQVIGAYYQGLNANPPPANLPLTLPSLKQGYRMLAFPEFATVGDLRAAAAAQLGEYNPIFYRIFIWQGNGYLELNNKKLSSSMSLMGTGVFALSRDGATLSLLSPDVTQNSTTTARTLVLQPGWNMISQPWINGPSNTMPLASLQLHQQSDLGDAAQIPAPGLTSTVVYEATGTGYVTSTLMTAGKAYWILNESGSTLYAVINFASVNQKSTLQAQAAATSVTPPPMPGGSLEEGSGSGGGCGLLGPEWVLVVLFLASLARRRLSA